MAEAVSDLDRVAVAPACYANPAADGDAGGAGRRLSAAAHRRHDELVAAAGAPRDLFTAAELQVGRHANPDLVKPPAAAGDRKALRREARISLDESFLDLVGSDRQGRGQVEVLGRNFHHRPGLANGFEIAAGRQARADAMAVPFVKN